MRTCSECKQAKDCTEFYNMKSGRNGKDNYCKVCRKEKNRLYNLNNRQRLNRYQNDYYAKNKERIKERIAETARMIK